MPAHYYATGITPAMVVKRVGVGAQYGHDRLEAAGARRWEDLQGAPAAERPREELLSFVLYAARHLVRSDGSFRAREQLDPDRTGKGWNVILRLSGPGESWFDKSWRPDEIELQS